MSWLVHAMCSLVLLGCATTSAAPQEAMRLPSRTDRYTWVDAHCSDGTIDLAGVGFERTVDVERRMDSVLLTFDTALATEGCRSLSVWTARRVPKQHYLYSLVPEAWVELPAGNVCGEQERAPTLGELHFAGDTLEIITQRSPWCRGYDSHFIYRATPRARERALDGRELVARYVAHFSRGDAGALAAMFESHGALIEAFSASDDGQPTRHEGRAAIRAYFERVFASARWHAARLIALSPGEGDNVIIADLEYMDSELSEPLRVRSSFVLAAGEIFESDTQLVTDPKPAPAQAVPARAGTAEPKS